ncbi:linear amide C-N hydrolase [Weissella kandleri]|nr:linear amide C-N hydrolase [Weissella kandleri]
MCTSLIMHANDGSTLLARTMDWHPFGATVLTLPQQYQWRSVVNPQRTLINPYQVLGVGYNIPNLHVDIADGINEYGLAMQKLTFNQPNNPNSTFKLQTQQHKIQLAPFEVVTWFLGNCQSIADVITQLPKIQLIPDSNQKHNVLGQTLHYALTDSTGQFINLIPQNGQLIAVDNPIGVVTNAPDLDKEITKLDQFLDLTVPPTHLNAIAGDNFNGKKTMPGGFTPSARFIRATILKEHAIVPINEQANLIETWHILNSVTVPKSRQRSDTYTLYRSAVDLQSRRLYFQPYDAVGISVYDFPQS